MELRPPSGARPGQTADGRGQEGNDPTLSPETEPTAEKEPLFLDDDEPCITEADLKRWGLLPVPAWARKPPGAAQPGLFDDE
jgi:hypothetical protein